MASWNTVLFQQTLGCKSRQTCICLCRKPLGVSQDGSCLKRLEGFWLVDLENIPSRTECKENTLLPSPHVSQSLNFFFFGIILKINTNSLYLCLTWGEKITQYRKKPLLYSHFPLGHSVVFTGNKPIDNTGVFLFIMTLQILGWISALKTDLFYCGCWSPKSACVRHWYN